MLDLDFSSVSSVICGISLSIKKSVELICLREKQNKVSDAISLPKKRVQRLNYVKVLGRNVRIKWNLLNSDNNNKDVVLKFIRKDGWTRSQKIWGQDSISGRGAWNEISVEFEHLDPSLWPSLPKAVPSAAAVLQRGQWDAAMASA